MWDCGVFVLEAGYSGRREFVLEPGCGDFVLEPGFGTWRFLSWNPETRQKDLVLEP